MSTIGDLTLNDIGRTRITIRTQEATVTGVVTEIESETEVSVVRLPFRELYEETTVRINITIGRIRIDGLLIGTECEVHS